MTSPLTRAALRRAHRMVDDAPEVPLPAAVIIELLSASLASGAAIPRALTAVGDSIEGHAGQFLSQAGRSLLLGAGWREAWEGAPQSLLIIPKTLRHSWEFGAPCAEALSAARSASEKEALTAAKERAQKLGVTLVVPLGLCFLPSFVALAVIPIVATLAEQWF